MAIASEGMMKNVRKNRMSSRNMALMSIIGVIGGSVLFFEYLKGAGQKITKPEEEVAWRGGNAERGAQTDQGTIKSAPRVKLPSRNE